MIHSERSDECFDSTMMYSITSRNNASISNFVGGFRWQSEYSWSCIIKVEIIKELKFWCIQAIKT
ncbi:Uncharacterized protein FWK35_00033554 [Aphis craccivora]|uniref:Uncharacterized protein n=1 Tax=Aphis craccivora TaxID=307492 RepID=A0A6G0VME4_APHCR|nr:Uncharacterized protein FWK35_00033554 [Aphis craccivora]